MANYIKLHLSNCVTLTILANGTSFAMRTGKKKNETTSKSGDHPNHNVLGPNRADSNAVGKVLKWKKR